MINSSTMQSKMNDSTLDHDSKLYTDTNTNIDKNISDGNTYATRNRKRAEEFAKERKSYIYDVYQKTKGRLIFWGYAVPKIILISFMLIGLNSQAQFITVPEDDINTQFGFFVDPTLTDSGAQYGVFSTMVMNWGYVGVSASTYPKLGGVGYTDLVADLGLNCHLFEFEPIRYYSGFRLGRNWRGGKGYEMAGGAFGFDWRVSRSNAVVDVFLGVKLWADYREDQKNEWFGDSDAYEKGFLTDNPLIQENGALMISFSF